MKKTKIALTATTLVILSLMITAYHTEPTNSPSSTQNCPVSEAANVSSVVTPLTKAEPVVAEKIREFSTQTKEIIKPIHVKTSSTQPTERAQPTNTATDTTQTATKPNVPTVIQPHTPKMGDTRIINGQKQSYFLGFGWIDYMGENECIFEEGMYENGNKIGIMGGGTMVGSDGDINKMVGIMD